MLAATVVGALCVGGILLARSGVVFAAQDEIGLQYGPASDPSYRGAVAPGQSISTGSALDRMLHGAETFYFYPTAAQTYLVGSDEAADTAPIVVVTKDGIRVELSGQLYFALNANPDLVRDFHEQIGLANCAAEGLGGWESMIDSHVRPQLDRALDVVSLRYDWAQLRLDADLRQQFEAEVGAKSQQLLAEAMGGSYFCGSAAAECVPFTFGLERLKPMNEELSTVTEDQAQHRAELQDVQEQIDVLGVDGYRQAPERNAAEGHRLRKGVGVRRSPGVERATARWSGSGPVTPTWSAGTRPWYRARSDCAIVQRA